jgi:hypothetical protein
MKRHPPAGRAAPTHAPRRLERLGRRWHEGCEGRPPDPTTPGTKENTLAFTIIRRRPRPDRWKRPALLALALVFCLGASELFASDVRESALSERSPVARPVRPPLAAERPAPQLGLGTAAARV